MIGRDRLIRRVRRPTGSSAFALLVVLTLIAGGFLLGPRGSVAVAQSRPACPSAVGGLPLHPENTTDQETLIGCSYRREFPDEAGSVDESVNAGSLNITIVWRAPRPGEFVQCHSRTETVAVPPNTVAGQITERRFSTTGAAEVAISVREGTDISAAQARATAIDLLRITEVVAHQCTEPVPLSSAPVACPDMLADLIRHSDSADLSQASARANCLYASPYGDEDVTLSLTFSWIQTETPGTTYRLGCGEEPRISESASQHFQSLPSASFLAEVGVGVNRDFSYVDAAREVGASLLAELEELAVLCQGEGTADTVLAAPAEFGVIERDGQLFLWSPPDGPLVISRSDLPEWARDRIVTVGAMIAAVGPFDRVTGGDDQVILDGLPVARLGDLTADGGTIVEGSPTIFINGVPAAFYGGFAVNPVVLPGPVPRVGGPILRCTDDLKTCIDEHPHPIALLVEPARQGDTVLEVDAKGFNVGDSVIIGIDNDSAETAKIEATGSMVLDRPLTRDHPAGAAVIRIPDEHANKVPPPSSATGTDTPMSRLLTTASGDGGGNTALIVGAVAIGALVLVAGAILLARRPRR